MNTKDDIEEALRVLDEIEGILAQHWRQSATYFHEFTDIIDIIQRARFNVIQRLEVYKRD